MRRSKKGEKKMKNKMSNKDKEKQKKNEAWNKIQPNANDLQKEVVDKIIYQWCIHQMAWTAYKLEDWRLGKDQDESLKPSPHTTLYTNASTMEKANESFLRALMSQLAAA